MCVRCTIKKLAPKVPSRWVFPKNCGTRLYYWMELSQEKYVHDSKSIKMSPIFSEFLRLREYVYVRYLS